MDETPTTDRVPAASDPWRSVYIASPRHLDGKRYAMIVKRDGGEETIAHNVTIAQALIIALEHRREHGAVMFYRDRGAFREYVIGRRRLAGGAFEPVLRHCSAHRLRRSRPRPSARILRGDHGGRPAHVLRGAPNQDDEARDAPG